MGEIPWKNNETALSSLLDPKFKKEVIKILKELRKAIDRNTDHYNMELETIKRSQLKLENSCWDENQAESNK